MSHAVPSALRQQPSVPPSLRTRLASTGDCREPSPTIHTRPLGCRISSSASAPPPAGEDSTSWCPPPGAEGIPSYASAGQPGSRLAWHREGGKPGARRKCITTYSPAPGEAELPGREARLSTARWVLLPCGRAIACGPASLTPRRVSCKTGPNVSDTSQRSEWSSGPDRGKSFHCSRESAVSTRISLWPKVAPLGGRMATATTRSPEHGTWRCTVAEKVSV
mmetsp:Transcript_2576/g.7295  ORF Transcript_2576/g.7295 Transcript_2576/m.7295 type:complete len:221 (-) Transcript_2576:760-1422(-)